MQCSKPSPPTLRNNVLPLISTTKPLKVNCPATKLDGKTPIRSAGETGIQVELTRSQDKPRYTILTRCHYRILGKVGKEVCILSVHEETKPLPARQEIIQGRCQSVCPLASPEDQQTCSRKVFLLHTACFQSASEQMSCSPRGIQNEYKPPHVPSSDGNMPCMSGPAVKTLRSESHAKACTLISGLQR